MSMFEGGGPCETDFENNDTVHADSASVSNTDTVQNTNAPSCHVEGSLNDNELLKGLLTDTFCQVCEAVLLFESQRVSHYEGKKHAQRVRIYLQTKKAEKTKQIQECGNFQRGNVNPEKFCELCNMVFSSPVVAKSHYEGKVHAKNMRKSSTTPSADVKTTVSSMDPLVPAIEDAAGVKVHQEQMENTASVPQEVDLSDPDKYCKLCTTSFTNPYMAQQHYSGRKHQRNQARQEMIVKLSEDSEHGGSLTCPVCCVTLNSVETYQAHMQGNKHFVQEKKIVGLCKSQKKVYGSFQDELADYIQVQKARGLEPKTGPGSEALGQRNPEEGMKDNGQSEEDPQIPLPPRPHLPPPPPPPPPPLPLPFRPPHWHQPFQPRTGHFGFRGRFPVQHQWGQGYPPRPPPLIPGLTGRSLRRGRSPDSFSSSSSSSSSFSSSSSSSSSSESSSNDSRDRRRRKRKRTKRRNEHEDDSEKDERKKSKRMRIREEEVEQGHIKKASRQRRMSFEEEQRTDENKERKKWKEKRHRERDSSEEDDIRSKKRTSKKRQRRKEEHNGMRRREEDKVQWSKEAVEGVTERGEGAVLSEGVQAIVEEHTEERSEDKEERPKRKKEKKKAKGKMDSGDSRTEEEKLWDETILGMF